MKLALSSFILFVSFLFTVSGQMVYDETFVPVPSSYVGSQDAGCGLACMTSMLASLNDPRIGTNVWEIYQGLLAELPSSDPPYSGYDLTKAAVAFLISVL